MNFRTLTLKNSKEWRQILSKVDKYDFYHTPHYHQLDTSGDSKLLVFEKENEIIALPLLFRKIENTSFVDVTSVYGYAGWLRTKNTEFSSFETAQIMTDYFVQENVISGFSRIHPLIEGANKFPVGEVSISNKTLGINLKQTQNLILKSYSRSVRTTINRETRTGISVREIKDIDLFSFLYDRAMQRLNAPKSLRFSKECLENLLHSTEYETFILSAELSGAPIAVAMFVICGNIMQYHLGAVADLYIDRSPLKLLIDEARKIGQEKGLSVLHLGGGYGGNNNGLYTFKSRMSSLSYNFEVWKWIVNEDVYKELSLQKTQSSYFPLYRS